MSKRDLADYSFIELDAIDLKMYVFSDEEKKKFIERDGIKKIRQILKKAKQFKESQQKPKDDE